jgi:hypothetical protein
MGKWIIFHILSNLQEAALSECDLSVYAVYRNRSYKGSQNLTFRVSHPPHPLTARVGDHPLSSTCRKVAGSVTFTKAAGF